MWLLFSIVQPNRMQLLRLQFRPPFCLSFPLLLLLLSPALIFWYLGWQSSWPRIVFLKRGPYLRHQTHPRELAKIAGFFSVCVLLKTHWIKITSCEVQESIFLTRSPSDSQASSSLSHFQSFSASWIMTLWFCYKFFIKLFKTTSLPHTSS